MPSPVERQESAIPCSPPTDPTGFIYSSYRAAGTEAFYPSYRAAATETHRDKAPLKVYPTYQAAQTETHVDKPSLKSSHQRTAYVSSSVGGSVSTLSFEDTKRSNRLSPPRPRGGGIRDRVRGFSRESRRNLLRRLASINRRAFNAFKGRMIFVTLTYPGQYPQDPVVCKNHLKALRRRLQREFGIFAAFWRLGIQQRGAWHFHLLLFVGPSIGSVGELRHFISSSWYEVAGKVSEGHLRTGTRVEAVKNWKQATSCERKASGCATPWSPCRTYTASQQRRW
jgi:hypothetical protein